MAGVLRRDDRTGLSARHIIAKISDGSFPGQVKIGEHTAATGASPPSTNRLPIRLHIARNPRAEFRPGLESLCTTSHRRSGKIDEILMKNF
jgi:hypothetical protein